jgi:hypothetical protein
MSTLFAKYRKTLLGLISHFLDPFSSIGAILWFVRVDFITRYGGVFKHLNPGSTLDVGAGGQSMLAVKRVEVLSLDLKDTPGVDIVASASHLPFQENSFINVIAVDTIEHIPNPVRQTAVLEMMRVAREKTIIHCPLDDGDRFQSRRYDIAFNHWYQTRYTRPFHFITEHIQNIEPPPHFFEDLQFTIQGTDNAPLWYAYMKLSFLFSNAQVLNILLSWMYFLVHKAQNTTPPYWAGICVYTKVNEPTTSLTNQTRE